MSPGRPSASPWTRRTPLLAIGQRARASTAAPMRPSKKAASTRSLSAKLQARRRIDESGLYAAQARKRPPLSSTRTVSPESALPPATLPSKIQGCRRSAERSLPGRRRTVFIAGLLPPRARMSGVVHLREVAEVELGVDLRGRDVGVA